MNSETEKEQDGVGRFSMPREKWILDQLPEMLKGFFGYRDEYIPDRFCEAIDYTYWISYPDGSGYDKEFLIHYLVDNEVPTAFIIGDTVILDGVPFRVLDYTSERQADCTNAGDPFSYTYWRVRVVPAGGGRG